VEGRYQAGQVAPWGVELKSTGQIIGTCDYVWWHPQHACAEIGYALSRAYWGRGLMTEAVRAIMQFGFARMHLNRIQAMCMVKNLSSERVMQKAGMQLEGTLR
jgi:ribosomal-protein-alanine N-acetyltransferase